MLCEELVGFYCVLVGVLGLGCCCGLWSLGWVVVDWGSDFVRLVGGCSLVALFPRGLAPDTWCCFVICKLWLFDLGYCYTGWLALVFPKLCLLSLGFEFVTLRVLLGFIGGLVGELVRQLRVCNL